MSVVFSWTRTVSFSQSVFCLRISLRVFLSAVSDHDAVFQSLRSWVWINQHSRMRLMIFIVIHVLFFFFFSYQLFHGWIWQPFPGKMHNWNATTHLKHPKTTLYYKSVCIYRGVVTAATPARYMKKLQASDSGYTTIYMVCIYTIYMLYQGLYFEYSDIKSDKLHVDLL